MKGEEDMSEKKEVIINIIEREIDSNVLISSIVKNLFGI